MPETKTDWHKLKQEYLQGDAEDVAEFLRVKLGSDKGRWNGYKSRMTKGWKKERAELKQAMLEEAKKKMISDTAVFTKKLLGMKKNVIIIAGNRLDKVNDELTATELKTLWHIIKTELGEVTSYETGKIDLQNLDENGRPTNPNVQMVNNYVTQLSNLSKNDLKLLKKLKQKTNDPNAEESEE